MSAALVTAEELLARPHEDRRWELVRGRLVPMSPVSFEHGRVVMRVGLRLGQHLLRVPCGVVVAEVGFVLETEPDTVRAPDVAFVREERVPSRDARGFFVGAPDLAIEVLSPDDRAPKTQIKIEQYLAQGVGAVVVIDPIGRSAQVARATATLLQLVSSDILDLSDVVPGFRCALHELFD